HPMLNSVAGIQAVQAYPIVNAAQMQPENNAWSTMQTYDLGGMLVNYLGQLQLERQMQSLLAAAAAAQPATTGSWSQSNVPIANVITTSPTNTSSSSLSRGQQNGGGLVQLHPLFFAQHPQTLVNSSS